MASSTVIPTLGCSIDCFAFFLVCWASLSPLGFGEDDSVGGRRCPAPASCCRGLPGPPPVGGETSADMSLEKP
ncbi:unnamed protein product [Linum trigynum]|uniref:Secreted protein n=1 Tax=Linum trigynum TaxID=586398 RepID=A0AAV2CTP4_9ROSI